VPLRLADEVALVLALQNGLLDRAPLEQIGKFRAELPGWLDRTAAPVVDKIERSGSIDDTQTAQLKDAVSALAMHLAPSILAPEPRTK
jgi:F-type H+/Na+-transporting ATPase subunit alpha